MPSTPAHPTTAVDDYVIDVLMRDLVGHDHRPVAFLIYLWLSVEQRRKDAPIRISYQALAENIGVSKSSVQSAVSWLVKRRLLAAEKGNVTAVPRYTILFPWRDRSRQRKPSPS